MTEYIIQSHFFRQVRVLFEEYPAWRFIFAVPNGGFRSGKSGAIMRNMGLNKGCPDVWYPCPIGGYHGLVIEFKMPNEKATPEQSEWLAYLDSVGYKTAICFSALEGMSVLSRYETTQV